MLDMKSPGTSRNNKKLIYLLLNKRAGNGRTGRLIHRRYSYTHLSAWVPVLSVS